MEFINLKKYNFLIVFIASITIPFLSFINVNFQEINQTYLYEILKYFILHFTLIILFGILFKLTFFRKFKIFFLINTLSILLFINFHYIFFWELLPNQSLLVLTIIILLNIIYIISCLYNIRLIINFIITYLIISFGYQSIIFLSSIYNYETFQLKQSDFFLKNNKIDYKKNVYYIILDTAEKFENINDKRFKQLKLDFKNNGLKYINEFSTNYDATHLMLSSFLNLDYIIDINQKYTNRDFLFPNLLFTLEKENTNIKLINLLNSAGIKFKWIGNQWADCNDSSSSLNFCIYPTNQTLLEEIFNSYVFEAFYKSTPVFTILKKLKLIKISRNISPENRKLYEVCNDDNAICKMNYLLKDLLDNNDKNYFFLIHHLSPHSPFMYNYDNCKANLVSRDKGNYVEEYYCTLIETLQLIQNINQNDPDALIIIQSDTGKKGHGGLNMVKINSKCFSEELFNSNIETIRNVLRCIYKEDLINENFYSYNSKEEEKYFFIEKKN